MRSPLIMATVVSAAIALAGCHNKKPEPVPGPQSARLQLNTTVDPDRHAPQARAPALSLLSALRLLQSRPGWACSTAVSAGDSSITGAFARKRAKWTG